MTEGAHFFSHLLGEHWGTEVKMDRSRRSGYDICIYYGDKPDTKASSVLHLNLKHQTGLHDSGMHWRTYLAGGERTGHAWDDNLPDPALVPCAFEAWVIERIGDIIDQLSRIQLSNAIERVKDDKTTKKKEWSELRSILCEVEERLQLEHRLIHPNQGDIAAGVCDGTRERSWETTLGLTRCAIELGEPDKAQRLLRRFTNGYFPDGFSCLTLVNSEVQALLPPLLNHDPAFWCALVRAPMQQLADYPPGPPIYGDSAQRRFFVWLNTIESQVLMKTWIEAVLQADTKHTFLMRYAALLNLETMADLAVILMEAAIEQVGEDTEYLIFYLKALQSAGQEKRAAAINDKLESIGFNPEILALHEAYKQRYWPIAVRSRRDVSQKQEENVLEMMDLEDRLNDHWFSRPVQEHPHHIKETHFVCGGTLFWVVLCQKSQQPDRAIERIESFFADWERVTILAASDTSNMESLIDEACLAYMESTDPQGKAKAYRLIQRVHDSLPTTQDEQAHYNYACIFGLCGDIERALEHLAPFVTGGDPDYHSRRVSRIRADKDFDGICKDPRFVRGIQELSRSSQPE